MNALYGCMGCTVVVQIEVSMKKDSQQSESTKDDDKKQCIISKRPRDCFWQEVAKMLIR